MTILKMNSLPSKLENSSSCVSFPSQDSDSRYAGRLGVFGHFWLSLFIINLSLSWRFFFESLSNPFLLDYFSRSTLSSESEASTVISNRTWTPQHVGKIILQEIFSFWPLHRKSFLPRTSLKLLIMRDHCNSSGHLMISRSWERCQTFFQKCLYIKVCKENTIIGCKL